MKKFVNKKTISHSDVAMYSNLEKFLRKNYVPKNKLLDLGCGAAVYTHLAKEIGYDTYAVDIKKPETLSKKVYFTETDLNTKGLKQKGFFDVVICTEFVEHIENPHKLFRELNKVMKINSVLYFSCPNIQSLLERIHFLLKGEFKAFPATYKKYGHVNPVTLSEIKLLSSKYGFEIIEIKTEGIWIPLLRKYLSEKFRPLFGNMFGKSVVLIMTKKWNCRKE